MYFPLESLDRSLDADLFSFEAALRDLFERVAEVLMRLIRFYALTLPRYWSIASVL